jgi:hypothetical protein
VLSDELEGVNLGLGDVEREGRSDGGEELGDMVYGERIGVRMTMTSR